jgi:hypothetical protein
MKILAKQVFHKSNAGRLSLMFESFQDG